MIANFWTTSLVTPIPFLSLGWEFVSSVLHDKGTFRGFVAKMNEKYEIASSPHLFMSLQTFIDWFFGWASSMKIDFRKGCKICGDNPKASIEYFHSPIILLYSIDFNIHFKYLQESCLKFYQRYLLS